MGRRRATQPGFAPSKPLTRGGVHCRSSVETSATRFAPHCGRSRSASWRSSRSRSASASRRRYSASSTACCSRRCRIPHPDRLVAVYDTQPACATCPASFPEVPRLARRGTRSSPRSAASTNASFVMTGRSASRSRSSARRRRRRSATCSACPPMLGRWYTAARGPAGRPEGRRARLRVLDAAVQRRPRRRRPDADASTATPYEVIGVMPKSFTHRNARLLRAAPAHARSRRRAAATSWSTYARLKTGVHAGAGHRRDARARRRRSRGSSAHNHGIDVKSLREVRRRQHPQPLQVLLGAVVLRAADRVRERREPAARVGARAAARAGDPAGARRRTRGDLARQLTSAKRWCWRSTGACLGLLLAIWTVRIFVALAADTLPRAASIHVDGTCRRVHGRRDAGRRHVLRTLAARPAARRDADRCRPRRGHAHRQRAPGTGSATASSSSRSRWRLRCSSAPGCS